MEKKALLTAIFISALLFSALAGPQVAYLVWANPFTNSVYSGEKPAPMGAPSPIISILSPEEDGVYNTDSVTLTFNVSVEEFSEGGYNSALIRGMRIDESFYSGDWLQNATNQIDLATYLDPEEGSNRLSVSLDLTGIPDGEHVIRVFAIAYGTIIDPFHWYKFKKTGYSWVDFTIDTTCPSISVLSVENELQDNSGISLRFTVDEPFSQIAYSLDGRDNVTVAGNTTLTELSGGAHKVIIYAWDAAGNLGTSETIAFTVAEPFPTLLVVITSVASIAVVSVALLVYFRKRKKESGGNT